MRTLVGIPPLDQSEPIPSSVMIMSKALISPVRICSETCLMLTSAAFGLHWRYRELLHTGAAEAVCLWLHLLITLKAELSEEGTGCPWSLSLT